MNWWLKFLALLVLNAWLHPVAVVLWAVVAAIGWWWHPTVAVAGLHVALGPGSLSDLVACWLILLIPTLWLLAGIASDRKRLPRWCWQFDTPDATLGSPYSQQEQGAAPYYTFTRLGPFVQRIIGDYRWFAVRNLWYGISFKWGLYPDESWTFQFTGSPYTADTDPKTGKYVFGRQVIRAFKREGEQAGTQVGWSRRGTIMLPRGKFMKYWWGWKLSEYVQTGVKPTPPAMIAMQIEIRSA